MRLRAFLGAEAAVHDGPKSPCLLASDALQGVQTGRMLAAIRREGLDLFVLAQKRCPPIAGEIEGVILRAFGLQRHAQEGFVRQSARAVVFA